MGLTDSTLKKIKAAKESAQKKTAGKDQEVSDVCTAAEKLVLHTAMNRIVTEKNKVGMGMLSSLLCVPFRLTQMALRWDLMTDLAGAIDRLLEEPSVPEPEPVEPAPEEIPEESAEPEEEVPAEEPVPEEAPAEEPAVEAFAQVAEESVAEENEDGDEEEDDAYEGDLSELEFIDVMEQPEAYQVMLEQESRGEVRLVNRYRRSFRSRLIQSQGNVQEYYSIIKNALLSYKGVKDRTSWSCESFNRGRAKVAKITAKTRTLYLYLAIDPASLQDTKYFFDDMSAKKKYAEVPVLLKIKGERKLKHALELIEKICSEQMELPPVKEFEPTDYIVPYQDTKALVQEGLIKQMTAAVPVGITAGIPLF